MTTTEENTRHFTSTKRAVIWVSLFNEPLQVLYFSFLSVILYRDLGATPTQIAALTMLRPLVSLLSLYWSTIISKKREKLVVNLIITGILARAPFFFFPFIQNPWFVIAGSTLYMMLSRGGIPAWIEVMKQNLPEEKRNKIFSLGSSLGYLEGVLLALGMGAILDNHHDSWKWLFPVTATIGLIGTSFKAFIPEQLRCPETLHQASVSIKEFVVAPWRDSWKLMQERNDFANFQWGFMLAGAAIMLIQPALPFFFVDYLHVTYLDLAIALSVCKGLGFATTSSFWTQYLQRTTLFTTSMRTCIFLILFPCALGLALVHPIFLYVAYFLYGIGQSGSHLIWHLSGAKFSHTQDSSPFTNVNILTVGLRGLVAPPLGGLCTVLFGPIAVFSFSVALCSAAFYTFSRHVLASPACNTSK